MNIEKLAKHLKEFSLDEIEMIAECDCKTALEQLLNNNKIVFEQGLYKHIEKEIEEFSIFTCQETESQTFTINAAVNYFLENYVKVNCKKATYTRYKAQFKFDIVPYFRRLHLNDINNKNIKLFYSWCCKRGLPAKRIKNTLSLLNQLIKYFQNLGMIDDKILSKSWDD